MGRRPETPSGWRERRADRRATRELDGDVHALRVDRLGAEARCAALSATVTRRRRGDCLLTVEVHGHGALTLWSYWPRTTDVVRLLDVFHAADLGWVALFEPAPGADLSAPGIVESARGRPVLRLIAWRAEFHPHV